MGRSTRAETQEGFSTSEIRSYAAIVLVLAALDVAASLVPGPLFGFSQLRWWGLLAAGAAVGVVVLARRLPVAVMARLDTAWVRMAFAGACGIAFFILRSWFINPDGALFPMKFMVDVPARGFHATHDEMWELYIHSKFWLYANDHFGWSVVLSYQVLSCAAGVVFVFLLLTWCRRLLPQHWPLAFLACVSGGYMQLFSATWRLHARHDRHGLLPCLRPGDRRPDVDSPIQAIPCAGVDVSPRGWLSSALARLPAPRASRRGQGFVVVALAGFVLVVAGTFCSFISGPADRRPDRA